MTCMTDTSDAGLWYALNRLETDYWWDVDLNGGRNAHEFYLPDGLYLVGQNRFAGHDQIRAFYTWRARRGPMTSRHLINNLKVSATDDHHAGFVAALSLFRANGPPPVQRAPSPCLIADVISECVCGEDGTGAFGPTSCGRSSSAATVRSRSRSTDSFCRGGANVSPKRR